MGNVIPLRSRGTASLFRLSVSRAKALGVCPAPANDAKRKPKRASVGENLDHESGLEELLERSIRALEG